jgi:hypothetical protein
MVTYAAGGSVGASRAVRQLVSRNPLKRLMAAIIPTRRIEFFEKFIGNSVGFNSELGRAQQAKRFKCLGKKPKLLIANLKN